MKAAIALACALVAGACSGDGDGNDNPGDPDGGTTDDSGPPVDALAAGTAGCGKAVDFATAAWVEHFVPASGGDRAYFVRLPDGYDPERRYPVVYQQHGCSTAPNRETNNVPLEGRSGANAILVRGKAAGNCWDTSANGPDLAYWDAMVAATEAALCIDPARRFATGYSSGSFMTHRLACVRGDKLRGIATIAGGQGEQSCAGSVAAALIHDLNDNTVNISASIAARNSHLARNGCDAQATPTPIDPAPCVAYTGCTAGKPVVWCQTTGKDHSRQDAFAAPIFWDFLEAL